MLLLGFEDRWVPGGALFARLYKNKGAMPFISRSSSRHVAKYNPIPKYIPQTRIRIKTDLLTLITFLKKFDPIFVIWESKSRNSIFCQNDFFSIAGIPAIQRAFSQILVPLGQLEPLRAVSYEHLDNIFV